MHPPARDTYIEFAHARYAHRRENIMQEPKSPSSMQGGQYTDYGTPHTDDEERSMQERAAGMADKAQEKVSDYGSKLQEQADVNIDRAADGLEKAAEEMRSRMADKGGMQSQVGTRV